MPTPPPKVVNLIGVAGTTSASSLNNLSKPKVTGAQADTLAGNIALDNWNAFIFAIQTVCLQYKIGLIGYADPASANSCACCPHNPRLIFGMIQLVNLNNYVSDQLWNFQYIRYAANNNWRPWNF